MELLIILLCETADAFLWKKNYTSTWFCINGCLYDLHFYTPRTENLPHLLGHTDHVVIPSYEFFITAGLRKIQSKESDPKLAISFLMEWEHN